jgi:hypothetical protein
MSEHWKLRPDTLSDGSTVWDVVCDDPGHGRCVLHATQWLAAVVLANLLNDQNLCIGWEWPGTAAEVER